MKNILKTTLFLLFSFFCSLHSNAQWVNGMSYQAVIRNSSNALITNTVVGVKVSILETSASGTVVFAERHTPTTNANGLATFVIGEGTAITSDFFSIDWKNGFHFIKIETDPTGGTAYSITNTSQLNAVPYAQLSENAYYASYSGDSWKKTGNVVDATTDFIGSTNDVDVIFKRNNMKAGLINSAFENTSFGLNALSNNTTGQNNTAIGNGALQSNLAGFNNIGLGTNALRNNNSNANTAVGVASAFANTSGVSNTSMGHFSLKTNTIGGGNVAIGNNALENSIGYFNTALGLQALSGTTGDQNTAIGWRALENLTTGGGNIGIGKIATIPSPSTNNQLSIGNVIYGTNMGNTTTGTIGIGVPVPTEKLEVAGKTKTTNLQVTNGAGANKVLTSDANGNAIWTTPVSSNANTGVHLGKTTFQTIPNGIDTKIIYNEEYTDDANTFNSTTGEWVIPSTGFYHIHAACMFTILLSVGTKVDFKIYKNGSIFKTMRYTIGSMSGFTSYDISADLKLNANDSITVYIFQNSGASVDTINNSQYVYVSGFKVY